MKLFIDRDFFDSPKIPPIYLCNTSRKRIGELPVTDLQGDFKWNSYSEIQFVVSRTYTDVLTGETVINPLFDKIESPRNVYLQNIGFFTIQDVDTTYGEKDEVQVSAFSIEYTAGQKYLNLFKINKGEEDSKEVIYATDRYGPDAQIKDMYKLANANLYDSNERYFHRVYTDSRHYDYEQIQITDETAYLTHFGEDIHPEDVLYIHGWASVKFYDPNTPELSLLHLVFNELPEWKIGHVDYSLRHKERSFDEDRVAIYDFIMQEVCDTFKCVCEWDTIEGVVNFYEEVEDGIGDDNTVATKYETDILISRDNLASEISVSYSADDIKTRLKVSGSDDLDIREINLGQNYIMNLDYYHPRTGDIYAWMEQDLYESYDDYLEAVEYYTPIYTEATQRWVEANNKYNDMMNAVPAEGNVVLVGDPFKKLYCTYTPINTAYYKGTIQDNNINTYLSPDVLYLDDKFTEMVDPFMLDKDDILVVQGFSLVYSSTDDGYKFKITERLTETTSLVSLIKKLNLYNVDEDLTGIQPDNILLRLDNKQSDTAVIRIYDPKQQAGSQYNSNTQYYTRKETFTGSGVYTYTQVYIKSTEDFSLYSSGSLFTNNYQIRLTTISSLGITNDINITNGINMWIRGELTSEALGLKDYTIRHIGTMGSYFVLAKDEKVKVNLQDYGVNMLKAKQAEYLKIFQTQTEGMLSNEGYQCVALDNEPNEPIPENTRWFDTNDSILYRRTNKPSNSSFEDRWISIDKEANDKNYKNYQRYIDNYEKLQSVTEVLATKEREATYQLGGYAVTEKKINLSLYEEKIVDGQTRLYYNNQDLEGDMHTAAELHFKGDTIGRVDMDYDLPMYTFTTSSEPKSTFVVYISGITPHVAYDGSREAYQIRRNYYRDKTDFEKFFDEDQWVRLSPLIREDEFSDSNFLLNGYESEEERLEICKELMESANKELKKLCQPSLEFSMEMANILALPEFKSLTNQFQLGNFVRVHIRDGYVKRARLLEVHLNFSNLSDFNCNFGNLVSVKSEIDKHAELLSQAVQAGKTVATSAGSWQRAVDKSNKLEQDIANGLSDATLEIGKANGQSIELGQYGLRGRKLIDGTTDQYEDEQVALINNKLVFTADGWKTSKAAFGKFTVDGVDRWGVLSDACIAGFIEGATIRGGNLLIGDGTKNYFQVSEAGDVSIFQAGEEKYAAKSAVQAIDDAYRYQIVLLYDKSTVFGQPNQTCTLTCKVYELNEDITPKLPSGTQFSWLRNGAVYKTTTTPTLEVTANDVDRNSVFACSVTFDETEIK